MVAQGQDANLGISRNQGSRMVCKVAEMLGGRSHSPFRRMPRALGDTGVNCFDCVTILLPTAAARQARRPRTSTALDETTEGVVVLVDVRARIEDGQRSVSGQRTIEPTLRGLDVRVPEKWPLVRLVVRRRQHHSFR